MASLLTGQTFRSPRVEEWPSPPQHWPPPPAVPPTWNSSPLPFSAPPTEPPAYASPCTESPWSRWGVGSPAKRSLEASSLDRRGVSPPGTRCSASMESWWTWRIMMSVRRRRRGGRRTTIIRRGRDAIYTGQGRDIHRSGTVSTGTEYTYTDHRTANIETGQGLLV